MPQKLTSLHLAESLKNMTIQQITVEMTALIRSGAIEIGTQLPPVRELAEALGMSPASISTVWHALKKNKLIAGSGRNGVWVSGNNPSPRPVRFENVGNFGRHIKVDLTYASPDPALLPELAPALAASCQSQNLNSYHRELITPELHAAVSADWPYIAEALLATNGGFDGIQAVINALILPGSVVAIEDPTTARLLDLLDNVGARVIAIPCDDEGPQPEALAAALAQKPAAFIYQPRTHSVCGMSVSPQRFAELIPLLKEIPVIIEDDGIGMISSAADTSLGTHYPDRVVHVRSYSKTLGPDLRLAVLSAPKAWAKRIQAYRNFGASWTSRILQNAAAWMLQDPASLARIQQARKVYQQRRQSLTDALTQRQIVWEGQEGLSVWIPVPSEQFALVTLAVHGFAVFHGSRFKSETTQPHIRVETSCLQADQVESLADSIALCFDVE